MLLIGMQKDLLGEWQHFQLAIIQNYTKYVSLNANMMQHNDISGLTSLTLKSGLCNNLPLITHCCDIGMTSQLTDY